MRTTTGKWVLICIGNGSNVGKMVAKPGSMSSYTIELLRAQIFQNKEDAEKSACCNEYPKEVYL